MKSKIFKIIVMICGLLVSNIESSKIGVISIASCLMQTHARSCFIPANAVSLRLPSLQEINYEQLSTPETPAVFISDLWKIINERYVPVFCAYPNIEALAQICIESCDQDNATNKYVFNQYAYTLTSNLSNFTDNLTHIIMPRFSYLTELNLGGFLAIFDQSHGNTIRRKFMQTSIADNALIATIPFGYAAESFQGIIKGAIYFSDLKGLAPRYTLKYSIKYKVEIYQTPNIDNLCPSCPLKRCLAKEIDISQYLPNLFECKEIRIEQIASIIPQLDSDSSMKKSISQIIHTTISLLVDKAKSVDTIFPIIIGILIIKIINIATNNIVLSIHNYTLNSLKSTVQAIKNRCGKLK